MCEPATPPSTPRSGPAIEAARNFRDVGAAGPLAGSAIRGGSLFRSDSLHAASATDRRVLVEHFGIGAVLDLRTADETIGEGRAVLARDVVYANVPLEDVRLSSPLPPDPLVEVYRGHLERDQNLPVAVEVLATLLARRTTAVSCAAGKDRTGMVVALALALAGIPRDAIVEDYAASAPNMPAVLEDFRQRPRYRANLQRLPSEVYRCRPETMRSWLQVLDEQFGGPAGWARSTGVSTAAVNVLSATLLQPSHRP